MVHLGYLRRDNNRRYQLVSLYRFNDRVDKMNKMVMFKLSNELIMSISYKNISKFKAILSEMIFEENHKSTIKILKLNAKVELREVSKEYIKPSRGQTALFNKRVQELIGLSKYFAYSYGANFISKSQSTVFRYRQCLSKDKTYGNYQMFNSVLANFPELENSFVSKNDLIELNDYRRELFSDDYRKLELNKSGYLFHKDDDIFFMETGKRIFSNHLFKTKNYCLKKRKKKVLIDLDETSKINLELTELPY
jgi:hypothetical protein